MSKENLTESGFEPETYVGGWGTTNIGLDSSVGRALYVKPEVSGSNPDSVKFSLLI